MVEFYEKLQRSLKKYERFLSADGKILKNAVYEAAMKPDAELLQILMSDENFCKIFFVDVDGVKVFDKVKFAWAINNREFLPDSYTRLKTKSDSLMKAATSFPNQATLSWFSLTKIACLKAGRPKTIKSALKFFYNETLAPDDIDKLLAPKVLTCAKKFSAEGVEDVTSFSDTDNLIIKGNNLLACASLLKRFTNKIKCIYIDVPYNTGNDSFGYNDRFNHSTWLTFIKNRLELAKKTFAK